MSKEVQSYYDRHTRRFLRFGQHHETRNIHQSLWAPGVSNALEAANWSNQLILEALDAVSMARGNQPVRVLDLGCGVGSSIYYLARRFEREARYVGVSLSPVQIKLAKQQAAPEKKDCDFVVGDFLNLPKLGTFDFAFAIEAFLHATGSSEFFAEVASVLKKGGELVLVDDFLTSLTQGPLPGRERSWIADFRLGWLAGSLLSVPEVSEIALNAGLTLVEDQDLTPWMKVGRPRDKAIGVLRRVAGPLMRQSVYGRSLCGGYAKQQCLKGGLVSYRKLRFIRS